MANNQYQYYWDEEKQRFILLVDGQELDEFRTEKGVKMYARNAVKIQKD